MRAHFANFPMIASLSEQDFFFSLSVLKTKWLVTFLTFNFPHFRYWTEYMAFNLFYHSDWKTVLVMWSFHAVTQELCNKAFFGCSRAAEKKTASVYIQMVFNEISDWDGF